MSEFNAIHSVYSASSSSRWLNCPASIGMSKGYPEESDEFSELGTAGHELGEFCLKTGVNTYDCLGLVFNDEKVDAEMADAVQLYVSHVRDLCFKYKVNPMLEKRVVMTSVRNDVFGTSDCIVIVGEWLFVIDYKHGYDVVEVKNNSQAIHYAISTLDTFDLWNTIKCVRCTIVQPNSFHIDGAIRSHDYHVEELISWRARFSNAISIAESGSKPVAGEWCKRCPAHDLCVARFLRTVNLVYLDFRLTPESVMPLFKELSVVEKHLESVKKMMLEYARKGNLIEDYKLVNALPHAKCIDEEGFVKSAVFLTGRSEDEFYNRKLKGKGDCTKLVANDHVLIDDYFKRPDTASTKLVPVSDSRPAVSSKVFTSIEPVTRNQSTGIFEGIK